jgi:urea transport system permease protein
MSKFRFVFSLALLLLFSGRLLAADTPRQIIAKAIVTEDSEEQVKLVSTLVGSSDPEIRPLLTAWKESSIYIYEQQQGEGDNAKTIRTAVTLDDQQDKEGKQLARRVDDNQPLKDAKGQPIMLTGSDLTSADTDSNLRAAMKTVLDLADLSAADSAIRRNAVAKLGMSQDQANLAPLEARKKIETDSGVKQAIREAEDLINLKSETPATQIAAAQDLGQIGSIPSRDFLEQLGKDSAANPEVAGAAKKALTAVNGHVTWVNFYGTLFRGLSLGSVLLVMAIGLAITFGLMGVINMAHGELIAVGAYATYLVQNVFGNGITISPFGWSITLPGMHATGAFYQLYFVVALPVAFLSAALVGLALERGIIRFLYRRPLESLLATWGVSLVLQQLFRLTFGANNVQVESPSWLAGNWTVFDVILGWNRVFVICFAVAIIYGTHLLLTKTPLGLLIRAVMQNRNMAACMGVRTQRVNMLTFAFGAGLGGLAGAFGSQIGNVGPSMGDQYIVNAFMTVVVGGVGSLLGTVVSALGIGAADQSLQTILGNPVMGKILVLMMIILFLQWRPAGIFVTKTRSLEG